ncbi:hypothetical protein HDA32_003067 [Spinactinospora alkalitolerans]|uniref:Uncharacterized protein n=1 Tax=Spinactinospora alkalitolerans TaxID=687207 RepID=A0A852TXC2_9ACTN|nr:hypothetical protein [Spinactinospora alkalitolerans]NYE47947.1 hypothetical protein [Spinactinospora alkalitolerans]
MLVLTTAAAMVMSLAIIPAYASSTAVATGDSTADGRPVIWKNRDHWSTPDGWKVVPYTYEADGSSFGSGDSFGSRFDYTGITALGESGRDSITGDRIPWAGSNDRGLGFVQVAGHTLTSSFADQHGYPVSQDLDKGMTGGYMNHVLLSRAEHVDEVERILRDTNDGGGFNGSTARNTSTIISVFDRWGNAATFEIDGDSFTRDNVTEEHLPDGDGRYTSPHDDDKDGPNPPDGEYSGFDWRTNFSKVDWTKPSGFPYFVDEQLTTVDGDGNVVNEGSEPDGIHDWSYSSSAVYRHTRVGIRMDDPHDKNYRYFMQQEVESHGVPTEHSIETLSRSIGNLPYENGSGQAEKPTGWHASRFVSTFGFVSVGSKADDPYDGKLATIWVALGEPSVSVFVPIFPYAGEIPDELTDMYLASNDKRHQVYDYTEDDSCGYSCGRNVDHSIDLDALVGPGGYYGEGGIQEYTFGIEDWAFDEYDAFMADLRTGDRTEAELRADMAEWQQRMAATMKGHYIAGTVPTG